MRFKFLLLILSFNLWFIVSFAQLSGNETKLQAPSGLMCDLIANTESQNIGGYPTQIPISQDETKAIRSVTIMNRQPVFSWIVNDSKRNVRQVAWQIIVSDRDSNTNDTYPWNSGKIKSGKSSGIIYSGAELLPNHQYNWKVKVWNNYNEESPYSKCVSFKTADKLENYGTESYGIEKSESSPVNLKYINGVYRADFGKDAFGQLKIQLMSTHENDTVVIRIGEMLDKEGAIEQHPGGSIRYGEYRISLLSGIHTYQLQIHKDVKNTAAVAIKMPEYIGEVTPFRYCEISGYHGILDKNNITRIAVNYPFNDFASSFESSDSLLNQIWNLCKYSVKATSFAGIYVDGDRERTPYEADAYINQLCHYAVDREYSIARLTQEYLIRHANWPTEWILQSVLIAWNDYLYTGDIRFVQQYYDDLKAKTLMSLEDTIGLITVKKSTPHILDMIYMTNKKGLQDIVDWPHTGSTGLGKNDGGETDGFVFTKYNAVSNAFYYKALMIMQTIASDLGKKEDAEMFAIKANNLKKLYNKLFWDSERGVYCDGVSTRHSSLHSNVFALALGLVEGKKQDSVLSFIKSRGMACSVYGSQFLLDAVFDGGDDAYGLSLLTSKTERSWYHMLDLGSTMTLEAWDNKFKPNQDWNHIWGAAPANVISKKLMGIEPLLPGWSELRIAPKPGGLGHAEVLVPTIKGNILMGFTKRIKTFEMWTESPANTLAQVYLPLSENKFSEVTMDGEKVKVSYSEKGLYIKNVGSGKHNFIIKY